MGERCFFLSLSLSEASTRSPLVNRGRKPAANALWKRLFSTELSKGQGDDLPGDDTCTHTRSRSSWGTTPREKVTPVWNINQQVCAGGRGSARFYFFTCFLQLAGNVWSCGGLVWLCFSVHSGLLTYTAQWSSWGFDAGKMLLIHSSGCQGTHDTHVLVYDMCS